MSVNGNLKRGVTLYSYQEEFYTGAMTLADCMAELESMGCESVELLPEQMATGYPDIPVAWVDEWRRLVEKHRLTPTCMDCFVDTTCGGHRNMDLSEAVEALHTYMKVAKRLGFSMIRPTTGPVEEGAVAMVQAALPYAEKLDVKIAPEIHAPIRLRSKYIDEYLELIAKSGAKHFGFTLDLGIFCRHTPKVLVDQALRNGVDPQIVDFVVKAVQACADSMQTGAEVDSRTSSEDARFFARMAFGFGPPDNEINDIAKIAPHILNIHGKFYEMTETMEETTIPYPAVIAKLIECGVKSAINSEYEGQRFTQDMKETDSCEQIRRHQFMLKRLLGA